MRTAPCVIEATLGDVITVMKSGHYENLPQQIFTLLRERAHEV